MTIKSLKEKLTPGTKIKLANQRRKLQGPQAEKFYGTWQPAGKYGEIFIGKDGWFNDPRHKYLNIVREIYKVNSVDIIFLNPDGEKGYLGLPKKGELVQTDNGFMIQDIVNGEVVLKLYYEFVK